jgi:MHS family proline/betaine transporter-like MFS transporter
LAVILGWYLGPIPATLVEMFPTSIRYTGMSLAYNLCAILGGFTPSVAEWMIRETGNTMSIVWLMIGAGIASLISLSLYKDKWREALA